MSRNKPWQNETLPIANISPPIPALSKLEYFTGLAFHALITHGATRSAIPAMAIDRAKEMLAHLEQLSCDDTPPAA